MSIRTIARLGALPAATAAIALSLAAPAAAHVTATPSTAAAGAYTVVTFSVGHGCEGSPTTSIEIQVPESVLAVTPTRNPYYEVEKTMVDLDEPVADAHGNEVTERVGSIVYTADTPLPEGQRDTFELSFQLPDAEGEMLTFPTVQTCQEGETGWVEVPAEGQDADELDNPAPGFEILPAAGDDAHGAGDQSSDDAGDPAEAGTPDAGSSALGWAGLLAGLLGLAAGGVALARTRTSA
ncbi:DUF1775 domain-containing protein [Nocardioides eburneiflavus]|uniref:DUF1775 domain-containing protein n=1 Tax=Nocardioides eburneiflavus TaxID=2518372 RepID=A0A4Z1C2V0_9ACTN|nr:YcnI family protein [Nocardioides eburneiflavus]TGN64594.1 DUF1775 domain-containing protein [Nocardioides eburneiflavus]